MNLEQYKNIHKNEDIYVIASGKSCDFIEPSFFDNKITIGINQVYKRFKCSYYVRKEHKLLNEVLKNIGDSKLFISLFDCGSNIKKIKISLSLKSKRIIVYNHDKNNSKYNGIPKDNKLVVSYSTITTGIHLAAYMGAKNIILVGHDSGTLDNEVNFKGYHTESSYKIAWNKGVSQYTEWVKKVDNQTIELKKDLKKLYDINVYSLNPFINFNLENHVYKKN